jgi:TolB-like protein
MTELGVPQGPVRFGEFEVDLQSGTLSRQGLKVRLREQLLVALSTLIEHAGEVVTREQLQKTIWPDDVVVDFEINLNTIMAKLREALGDSAENPQYIETVPKRGYRFLAAVGKAGRIEPARGWRTRLIVLPFANIGGDPAEEYFSDSMTDEIITVLCQIAPERLAVIARTTAMRYKGSSKDVAHIGRELGVDYVVEGGVHLRGDRLTMNVQLIQASDQTHVFGKKYEAEMSDLFGLQGRVSEEIVAHIPSVGTLPRGDGRRRKPTENLQAYQLYLQGRHHMHGMTPDGFAKAKTCLDQAVALDPKFALVHDALADIYWWTAFFGYMPAKQASFAGLGAVLRAVEIDPTLGESHASIGRFRQKVDYNWDEVRREMTLALEMAPSSPLVRERYAISDLLPHGRLEEAIAQIDVGLEFDPMQLTLHVWRSTLFWLARDQDQALREARIAEALDPESYLPQYVLANAFRDGGHIEEALVHQRRAVERSGGLPQMLGWLSLTLARDGDVAGARSVLDMLRAVSSQRYVSPTCFVWVHAGLGEFDETMNWIERAIEERDSFIIPIKTYPAFDPLRSDPRFLALVRKMNLEP